jgi:hypothetical protein
VLWEVVHLVSDDEIQPCFPILKLAPLLQPLSSRSSHRIYRGVVKLGPGLAIFIGGLEVTRTSQCIVLRSSFSSSKTTIIQFNILPSSSPTEEDKGRFSPSVECGQLLCIRVRISGDVRDTCVIWYTWSSGEMTDVTFSPSFPRTVFRVVPFGPSFCPVPNDVIFV